jgi:hypothetical protein
MFVIMPRHVHQNDKFFARPLNKPRQTPVIPPLNHVIPNLKKRHAPVNPKLTLFIKLATLLEVGELYS